MADVTKVVTGKVRASYVNVFRPRKDDNGNEKYSMLLIIPKTEKATIAKLQAAIKAAANEFWSGKPPKNYHITLRDADQEAEDKGEAVKPEEAGCYVMNVSSNTRPGIVDAQRNEVFDASEFQSGDYCRVSLKCKGYKQSGNQGVTFYLNNVQVIEKGEPLGGQSRAEDDFDDWDDGDGAGEDWAA